MCGILRRAVEDAIAVEKMEGYRLNMGVWHMPNGVCKVCMAGAVMVKTLDVDRNCKSDPNDFGSDIEMKLYAINRLRMGGVKEAFHCIYGHPSRETVPQGAAMKRASNLIKTSFDKHTDRGYAE